MCRGEPRPDIVIYTGAWEPQWFCPRQLSSKESGLSKYKIQGDGGTTHPAPNSKTISIEGAVIKFQSLSKMEEGPESLRVQARRVSSVWS